MRLPLPFRDVRSILYLDSDSCKAYFLAKAQHTTRSELLNENPMVPTMHQTAFGVPDLRRGRHGESLFSSRTFMRNTLYIHRPETRVEHSSGVLLILTEDVIPTRNVASQGRRR